MIDMSVDIGGLRLKNPVLVSSGTFGFGREYSNFYDLNSLGGIAVKGITLKPRKGNKPPRIAETAAGILNSVGLENPGLYGFMEKELPFLKRYKVPIIANISGNTIEEYSIMAQELCNSVDAIELNVSCPNVKEGGIAFGTKPELIYQVTNAVKKRIGIPLIVKLSPNVTDISEMALAAEGAGADCISLINTMIGMKMDIENRKPYFDNVVAGLSGPAVKPIALRMVWQAAEKVNIPIIGMGGISTWRDAIEFIMAGAAAISIGTANFYNPYAPIEVLDGIRNYMEYSGLNKIEEIKINRGVKNYE
ncbi:dihydroorotate dehydrogenase [Lutispora thermophila]|uniref:Dihydroorotate dehydrogenase n=1 Tax=Lutispora saccharofermentans TaxID=3024236 RepID=A0ABT1N9Z2_9FIRM|nr:dihydroorotate dehydrogenase [Lutispora saccharofermentans]MCQ1528075.1 dihydroorotate dehydrogenase [Lutispora saccharofermentans]